MKKQANLHNFFQIRPEKSLHRKYFIYDPENFRAFFCTEPTSLDKFIVRKNGLQLYVRQFSSTSTSTGSTVVHSKSSTDDGIVDLTSSPVGKVPMAVQLLPHERPFTSDIKSLSMMASNIPVSVHKSNLQKAIRRGLKEYALCSAWAMLNIDAMEIIRRLAIIMIEDTTLIDRSAIWVWLMMAVASSSASESTTACYSLTEHDIRIILAMVEFLCDQKEVSFCAYHHDKKTLFQGRNNCIESKEEDAANNLLGVTDFRERGDELMPVEDLEQSSSCAAANPSSDAAVTEGPADYRHLSHDLFEKRLSWTSVSRDCPTMNDNLLALFYRIKYGGMPCDMELLTDCIDFFRTNNVVTGSGSSASSISEISSLYQIMPLTRFKLWQSEPRNLELSLRSVHILPEALDFHPLPQLIPRIHQKLQQEAARLLTATKGTTSISEFYPSLNPPSAAVDLSSENGHTDHSTQVAHALFAVTLERIQSLIWHLESAINVRRPKILHQRQQLLAQRDVQLTWPKFIYPQLSKERRRVMDNFQSGH